MQVKTNRTQLYNSCHGYADRQVNYHHIHYGHIGSDDVSSDTQLNTNLSRLKTPLSQPLAPVTSTAFPATYRASSTRQTTLSAAN